MRANNPNSSQDFERQARPFSPHATPQDMPRSPPIRVNAFVRTERGRWHLGEPMLSGVSISPKVGQRGLGVATGETPAIPSIDSR
jgi:hypothetical protein